MPKYLVTALCLVLVLGTAGAQDQRIYNDGRVDFATSAARFTLSAPDGGVGIREITYNINTGEEITYTEPIRLTEEGRHVIRYRSIDMTGNMSPDYVYTVVIDNTPPELVASTRGAAILDGDEIFIRGDTAVIVDAIDDGSGVADIFLSLDGRNFIRYTDAAFINEEGEHTVWAYAVDNVGNRSPTISVRGFVDNTPPTVRIVPMDQLTVVRGDRYSRPGNRFVVQASDELSGVERIEVSVNRQEFVSYTGPIAFRRPGFNSLRARAVDRVGNVSPITELSFYVEAAAPAPTISPSAN